jgi:CelD/BcsL family acetyltransferase involved in cellulose biosynthesis
MMDGQIANLGVSIRAGESLFCLFSLNMGIFTENSPGIIALYRRIRQASDASYRCLDLGFGSQHYKRQAATRCVERYEMLVPNPRSIRGQIYVRALERRLSRFTEKYAEAHRVFTGREP